jgi:nitrogen regulatory protein PII
VSAFDQRLITAIVPEDVDTLELAAVLQQDFGIRATFRHSARGVGRSTRRHGRAPLIPERRNVFYVIVEAERAKDVFDWLLEAARVDRYGGGLVFERRLGQTLLAGEA